MVILEEEYCVKNSHVYFISIEFVTRKKDSHRQTKAKENVLHYRQLPSNTQIQFAMKKDRRYYV
jgi:hypothetical protein